MEYPIKPESLIDSRKRYTLHGNRVSKFGEIHSFTVSIPLPFNQKW